MQRARNTLRIVSAEGNLTGNLVILGKEEAENWLDVVVPRQLAEKVKLGVEGKAGFSGFSEFSSASAASLVLVQVAVALPCLSLRGR